MLLEIDNFEQFKIFFDVVYDITDMIELQLFQEYMSCSILDKSHSRFMTATFKKDFFAVYEVDDTESVTLFAEDLHKIIKSAGKVDNVLLRTTDTHLVCKMESKNGNSRIFEFVLPVEYIESPQPPSISLPVTCEINIDDLKQGIKDLKIIGTDEIEFHATRDLVGLTAGTEVSTNYVYNIVLDLDTDYDIVSRFTLGYIEQLLKFDKISKVGKFSLGGDSPLMYSFEDDIMGVEISGLIAPRIEVD